MDDAVVGTALARIHEAESARDRGRIGEARGRFAAALDDARATGDPQLFARAALGLGGVWAHEHRDAVDQAHALAMQRFAVAQLEPHDPLAVRLSTRLAAEESYITGNPTAIRDALARARGCADPIARAEAVSLAHHCLLGPDHQRERLTLARESIECSAATGRSLDASLGLCWRTIDLFLGGDPRAERALEELRARDLEDCVQFTVLAMGVMQAIRAGELSRAENLARECYEFGLEVGDADALGWFGVQLVLIRWLQGRGAELLPFLADLRGSPTLIEVNDGFDAAIAVLAATDGQLDEARGALQRLLSRDRSLTRNSSTWLATLHGIVEAAYALEDAQTARIAYDLLAPYADRPVMVSFAVACFGSAHRTLGAAAATFGNLDLAVAHLDAAVATDLALGNRPCHALSCALLADVLERRGRPADRARLEAMRRVAVTTARECEMTARADAWSAAFAKSTDVECHREGRMWRVRAGTHSVLVADSVGMRYLAALLTMPGREIAAVDLAGQHHLRAERQPLADDAAVAAYRRRVSELQAEIDEADDHYDLERAALARADLDALVEEIRRTTGLLGRPRTFADEAERARTSVQKAIKRAITRVSEVDDALGRLIARGVVTGTKCSYTAEDA